MKSLRIVRFAAWAAVVVLGVGVAAIAYQWRDNARDAVTGIATASLGGPFKLTDQHGKTVTQADLQGHPSALFFGYTFCPDVCPTTLFDVTTWMKALGPEADKLKFYFITVDPARDTREQMASYLQAFDSRIIGLTGSQKAIDQIIKDYRIFAQKVPIDGGGYTMNHTASIYLLDSKAVFTSTVDYKEDTDTVMKKLHKLIESS